MRSIEGVERVVKMVKEAGFHLPLREAMVWRHIEMLGGRVRAIGNKDGAAYSVISVIIYMPESYRAKDLAATLEDLGESYKEYESFSGRSAASSYFSSSHHMPRPKRFGS